jgi:hypothetical protein
MQQEDINLIFYDLDKSYDSVSRQLLWKALRKVNVNQSRMLFLHSHRSESLKSYIR